MIVLLLVALVAVALFLYVTIRIGSTRGHQRRDQLIEARLAAKAQQARARQQERERQFTDDVSEALTSVMPAINLPLLTQPRDAPAPAFRPQSSMGPAIDLPPTAQPYDLPRPAQPYETPQEHQPYETPQEHQPYETPQEHQPAIAYEQFLRTGQRVARAADRATERPPEHPVRPGRHRSTMLPSVIEPAPPRDPLPAAWPVPPGPPIRPAAPQAARGGALSAAMMLDPLRSEPRPGYICDSLQNFGHPPCRQHRARNPACPRARSASVPIRGGQVSRTVGGG